MSGCVCMQCEQPVSPGRTFCDAECKSRYTVRAKKAHEDALRRESAERERASKVAAQIPAQNAPNVAQSGFEETIDDFASKVGTVAGGLFDFLVSPTTREFVERFDQKHGTNVAARVEARAPGAFEAFDGIRSSPTPPPPTEPAPPAPQAPASATQLHDPAADVSVLQETDRAVVIAMPDAHVHPCKLCKGRIVFGFNPTTGDKKAIPCPSCNAAPPATPKTPPALARGT